MFSSVETTWGKFSMWWMAFQYSCDRRTVKHGAKVDRRLFDLVQNGYSLFVISARSSLERSGLRAKANEILCDSGKCIFTARKVDSCPWSNMGQ